MSLRTTLTTVVICGLLIGMVAGCGSKVTKDNYDKVTNGMTEDEVKGILGEPTETASAGGALGDLVGAGSVMKWVDGEKSIAVTFVNGKVTAKVASDDL